MQTHWENRFALRTDGMKSSTIRELLKLTQQPDIISFAGGLPAPDVFPVERFQEASNHVLRKDAKKALQYSTTEGYLPLRELIISEILGEELNISPENVIITSGSQQALDLIGKVLLNPGDHILVESPTYLGALQAWNAYQAKYITVSMDDDGMQVDQLEDALRSNPKFIYVLPNFQNPTGVTLSYERRKKLVELADKYGVPIVEDDPYRRLRYEGKDIPSVIEIDDEFRGKTPYNGNVVYMSTFSKILAPGVRLAWVVGPTDVIKKMVQAKQGADLHTSTFNQYITYGVAKDGFVTKHIELIKNVYGERRNVMLGAMDRSFPPGVDWTKPNGGLFLWGRLPENINTVELLDKAVKEKVAFVPGSAFYPYSGGNNTMRINFSFSNTDEIEEGISRLGRVIADNMR
jgi:2-aminoadipate transaminase